MAWRRRRRGPPSGQRRAGPLAERTRGTLVSATPESTAFVAARCVMSCRYCSENWRGLGNNRPIVGRASSAMALRCGLLERCRRHDLPGGGLGAQRAGFGGNGQGFVLVTVGDD